MQFRLLYANYGDDKTNQLQVLLNTDLIKIYFRIIILLRAYIQMIFFLSISRIMLLKETFPPKNCFRVQKRIYDKSDEQSNT